MGICFNKAGKKIKKTGGERGFSPPKNFVGQV
jgi:hypothetical protein